MSLAHAHSLITTFGWTFRNRHAYSTSPSELTQLDGICATKQQPPRTETEPATPTSPPPSETASEAAARAARLAADQELEARLTARQLRRRKVFTLPELEMVAGGGPRKRWHAVAGKVVTQSRLRVGLGREITIAELKIEELGGRGGELVFGPVAVFNGQVSMRVKKKLEDVRICVRFCGEVEGTEFIGVEKVAFRGDLEPGLRSFLFGFNFPHVNLPPTSESPKLAYAFKVSLDVLGVSEATGDYYERNHPDVTEYASKPVRITFIPFVDPSLETPLVSRKQSVRTKRTRSSRPQSKTPTSTRPPSANTLILSDISTEASAVRRFPKPKLTLTTADLDSSLSSSIATTPVIDKPHPSSLSSAISRTTRITDDENATIARLAVELPRSRFLPGQEIQLKMTLQIRDGVRLPKGFGVRVLETRYLARSPTAPSAPDSDSEAEDEASERFRMHKVGSERIYQLTGKRFLLHPEQAGPIGPPEKPSAKTTTIDDGLANGTEYVAAITIKLPNFKTFIQDGLLPTLSLPLGNPDSATSPITPTSGKGKKPEVRPQELFFKVTHIVQITVLMNGAASWFTRAIEDKLEVAVPIIVGNKKPASERPPELRLNDDMGSWSGTGSWSESGSGSLSIKRSESASATVGRRRSSTGASGSGSGPGSRAGSSLQGAANGGAASAGGSSTSASASAYGSWRDGMRFLTLRETEARPAFVGDHF